MGRRLAERLVGACSSSSPLSLIGHAPRLFPATAMRLDQEGLPFEIHPPCLRPIWAKYTPTQKVAGPPTDRPQRGRSRCLTVDRRPRESPCGPPPPLSSSPSASTGYPRDLPIGSPAAVSRSRPRLRPFGSRLSTRGAFPHTSSPRGSGTQLPHGVSSLRGGTRGGARPHRGDRAPGLGGTADGTRHRRRNRRRGHEPLTRSHRVIATDFVSPRLDAIRESTPPTVPPLS